MIFHFETEVLPEWIDYNGHMRDSFYGLVFSLAVDALQDEVGFNEAYRRQSGCTIYLLEDHKFYLREAKQGDRLSVETRVLGCDAKRFHLHLQMTNRGVLSAVCEFMELHVQQQPSPHAKAMPPGILARLRAAQITPEEAAALSHRARGIGL